MVQRGALQGKQGGALQYGLFYSKKLISHSKDFMYECQPVRLEPVPALNYCVPHLASILKTSHLQNILHGISFFFK